MHPPPESESDKAPAAETEKKPESKPASEPATTTTTQTGNKEVTSDGYEVIRAKTREGESADVAVKAPEGWKVAKPPTSPDPHNGKVTLEEATKGLPGKGTLYATIATSMGAFQCELFADKAPITVANFVGLARGTRKFWSGKDDAWVSRPYYDNTTFHRVIPGFMIQGGDWAGDGSGNMYYMIPDELHPSLKHDKGGLLCMANRGPNTNEAQFFITEDAAPHLDSSYTIFGSCSPTDLVYRIARVPQSGPPNNRPLTPVVIEHVTIARGKPAPAAASGKPEEPLPKNTVPGVVPPGKAVQVPDPAKK